MKKTIAATTLGCKVNLYDTNALLEGFVAEGYTAVDFDDFADIYVINTCSVTNLADKKSRQMVSRARQRNPLAIIAAMGCSSQASPDKFGDLGVDIIMGTSRRGDLVAHIENYSGQPIVDIAPDTNEMRSYEEEVVANDTSRTRAFLKIQDGCDSFCAYCIIPYVRGRSRSRAYDDIMKQAQNFDDAGYKEIVVAGIHVASYGKDLKGKNLLDVLGDIAA
ncbi:MAG: tRNA (N(6)-L-threonylcarbamoyladenosine(37)-C(2))-methylthiotransferase MtaB, partial [Defluviitaleaceae bacterium]|nr:tRNA (N(6)-L-threonylcarbamoyladenosine(37)-C(2))-methylthiotransferase MtaB [Defluviitaleaceae bacterium]